MKPEDTPDLPQFVDAEAMTNPPVISGPHLPGYVSVQGDQLMEEKKRLIAKHHGGSEPLVRRIKSGEISPEEAMNAIIIDLLGETDSLKGSELLFEQDGNLRDAATVTVKRVEALEKVAKTLHRRHLMTHEEVVNLDSPYVRLLVSWFTHKVNECLRDLKYPQEAIDVFFGKLQLLTDDWKKEVKREMQAMQEQRGVNNEPGQL
jgi:hypothetical protein